MKTLKGLLLRLLGQEKYLRLVSSIFFKAYDAGMLRNNPTYFAHHMAARLVAPGETVIDIGANLGYYTRLFARLVGPQGKVLAVEPIPIYRDVLAHNVAGLQQVTILPYALGEKEATIAMGNPGDDEHRHGLMHVLSKEEQEYTKQVFEVPMKNPSQLFAELPVLHYVKCDVEGYEIPVIPLLEPVISRHQPIVQVETTLDNLPLLFSFFQSLQYACYMAGANGLKVLSHPSEPLHGDLIAIPRSRLTALQHLMDTHA